MLNPYRRSVCLPGKLGAGLVTGTEKIRCGYGNGDCLLLDFGHRIYAVADATERFPQASRLLLDQLAAAVAMNGPPENKDEFNKLLDLVWSRQKFIHKTTLSCVVLSDNEGGPVAMIANNGDSTITILDSGNGSVIFRTRVDMNFAGRSRQPNPVSIRSLNHSGATIVLATDGLSDIGDIRKTDIARKPDHLTQWIIRRTQAASKPSEMDDIGAIALATNGPATGYDTVIMGGTRPAKETDFVQSTGQRPVMDRWDTISVWQQAPELMDLAGIRIR